MTLKIPRQLRRRFHSWVWAYVPRSYPASSRPVSIVMPLAVKDIEKATRSIAALRLHLRHPIAEIVVPGQDHDDLRAFCARAGVRYVNEKDVLPRSVLDFDYAIGALNMNGWIRQQMLKLLAFGYVEADSILVFDADTFLVRDLSFFEDDRQLLFVADEYTQGYHALTEALLGPLQRHPRSFVAHFMLFQRDLMAAMQAEVERRCGLPFVEAALANIDRSRTDGMSEYEIYGNFLHSRHPGRFATRYWYNVKVDPGNLESLAQLRAKYGRFNSVSAHLH